MTDYILRIWCDIPYCIGYATHVTQGGTKLCRRHAREKKRLQRARALGDA